MAEEATSVETETPEQQLSADETAALTQLSSVTEPLRHSVSPAVSDFTGIGNNTALLASLVNWHAQGNVTGLVLNEQGPPGVQCWRLTHLGNFHAKAQNITKTPPAITTLTPSTASIATAAGKPVTIQVAGSGIRGKQAVQVNGVTVPSQYQNKGRIDMKYTLPAAPATVQVSVWDYELGVSSGNLPLTVTA